MNEQQLRIEALEAEMLAIMGVVGEVFRQFAQSDARQEAAVRAGFNQAMRILSQARDNPANAQMHNTLGDALKSMEWLTLLALAPTQCGKTHGTVQ